MEDNKEGNREDINSESIKGLAELFIKEPSSLEVLLMLTDEGPKTVKQISDEVIYDAKMTDILDKLRKFYLINIKDEVIDITSYGKSVVKKLCKHDVGGAGEFDNIDFSKLDIGNIISLCLRCKTKEDAEKISIQYEKYCDTPEIAHRNLGYILGYCSSENREKLYSLFPVNHPIFGKEFGRGEIFLV